MQYTLEFFIKYIDAEMDKRYTKLQKKSVFLKSQYSLYKNQAACLCLRLH